MENNEINKIVKTVKVGVTDQNHCWDPPDRKKHISLHGSRLFNHITADKLYLSYL